MSSKGIKPSWSQLSRRLRALDAPSLLRTLHDLYDATPDNRRFLHARFFSGTAELDNYRKLIQDAVAPNPLGNKPIRVSEARRLIRHYHRATDDPVSTTDLLAYALELGIEQSLDLGVEGDDYFGPLLHIVDDFIRLYDELPPGAQEFAYDRFKALVLRATDIGWGFGDEMDNLFQSIQQPTSKRPAT